MKRQQNTRHRTRTALCLAGCPHWENEDTRSHNPFENSSLRSDQWVEGITGTTIKDTRTKSRGRVEVGEGGGIGWGGVEGWGEKAYNCN